jgi:hypothetical protein
MTFVTTQEGRDNRKMIAALVGIFGALGSVATTALVYKYGWVPMREDWRKRKAIDGKAKAGGDVPK